jgi:hypothetical protein
VAPLVVVDPYRDIPAAWGTLNAWVHETGRLEASHQWLEEHDPRGTGLPVALYHPIRE